MWGSRTFPPAARPNPLLRLHLCESERKVPLPQPSLNNATSEGERRKVLVAALRGKGKGTLPQGGRERERESN